MTHTSDAALNDTSGGRKQQTCRLYLHDPRPVSACVNDLSYRLQSNDTHCVGVGVPFPPSGASLRLRSILRPIDVHRCTSDSIALQSDAFTCGRQGELPGIAAGCGGARPVIVVDR